MDGHSIVVSDRLMHALSLLRCTMYIEERQPTSNQIKGGGGQREDFFLYV